MSLYLCVFKEKTEAVRNGETLVERIRGELVAKHGELAREVQKGKKASADVVVLEQQVQHLLFVCL